MFTEPEEELIWPPWRPAALPVKLYQCPTWLKRPGSGSPDEDSLQTITWSKKESYFSKSNISQPVNSVNVASLCRPRAHVIVPFRLFHFCSMRYLCHIKARLLNPPFLAIVRHFLSLRDGWICLLGNLHQLHVINVSRLKEANCDSLNQQSFLLYLTALTEGSLRKPVSSGLFFRETNPSLLDTTFISSGFFFVLFVFLTSGCTFNLTKRIRYLVYMVNFLALLWKH